MTRTIQRSLVCSTLAVALGLVPGPTMRAASAARLAPEPEPEPEPAPDEEDPEVYSRDAVERFQAGEYDAAIELFERAYEVDPQPNYLFNIGRVYEEKGDLENAVVYYQRFVGQSGVDLESRQTATERLKILREALAQLEQDEPPEPAADPDEPEPDAPETTEPVVSPEDEAAAKRKRSLRISGYSLLGVGGGVLIVGGVFGGLASTSVRQADEDAFVDRTLAFRNRARRQARVADAMFITGGVVLVAGLALVLSTVGGKKSDRRGQASRRTKWSAALGPQSAGVTLSHRF